MRPHIRAVERRLSAHCQQLGIRPPPAALRRYALLRWIEACWWLADRLTPERADLLADLAERLRLDRPADDTPLCSPDLADCIWQTIDPARYAPWGSNLLMVSMRDLS